MKKNAVHEKECCRDSCITAAWDRFKIFRASSGVATSLGVFASVELQRVQIEDFKFRLYIVLSHMLRSNSPNSGRYKRKTAEVYKSNIERCQFWFERNGLESSFCNIITAQ